MVDCAAHVRPFKQLPQYLGVALAAALAACLALVARRLRVLRPQARSCRQVAGAALAAGAGGGRGRGRAPPLAALLLLLRAGVPAIASTRVVVSVAGVRGLCCRALPLPLLWQRNLIREHVGAQSGKQAGSFGAIWRGCRRGRELRDGVRVG